MISSSEAKANSSIYTQLGMNFIDKYRVKRLIKKIDKVINEATDMDEKSCNFVLTYSPSFDEDLKKMSYYMKNIATMYQHQNFDVNLTMSKMTKNGFLVYEYNMALSWKDTEFEKLMNKYK